MIRISSYLNLCICLSSFKLLFLKSYFSTDFDVHRNWLAIAYNLPIRDWYFDKTSQWTLDYPPLFAAFEFLLALIAHLIGLDKELELTESHIRTERIIIYQKLTVILSDSIYYYGVYKLCSSIHPLLTSNTQTPNRKKKDKPQDENHVQCNTQNLLNVFYKPNTTSSIALLLLIQPGLLLVDHIHFQYNGMLFGILLLSVANIISKSYAAGSFWFALLLNFKHLYLYYAPAYGMYLLVSYCLSEPNLMTFTQRVFKLAAVVLAVFIITYFPFADYRVITQILNRLFPFKRGLTHAYWAPNIWSLYNTADKVLASVLKEPPKANFDMESISPIKTVSSTSGLVQEYEHQYLPSIQPMTTFILVGLFTIPLVIKFLLNVNRDSPRLFIKGLTITGFTAFMFGWHVHEKAILMVLVPLIPSSFINTNLTKTFLRLTLAGTYQLFPLFFEPAEYVTKLSILIAYYYYARTIATRKRATRKREKLYNLLDIAYVFLIVLVELYISLLHGKFNYSWNPLTRLNKFTFLPLMLTSSLSAIGIFSAYIELYVDFLRGTDDTMCG